MRRNGFHPGRAGFLLMLISALLLFAGEVRAESAAPMPAVMVQIKCKPGTAELWQAAFEKEIVPSIHEAIAKGDGYSGFTYYEAALPSSFDFVLVFTGGSFAALDVKRPFPHYVALYRRVGPARAQQILAEMNGWEANANVVFVRAHP